MSDGVTINDKRLKGLIDAFKGKIPKVSVGIIGGSGDREAKAKAAEITFESLMRKKTVKKGEEAKAASPSTNAEILAAHEYGAPSRGLPQRSVLRVPISEHLARYLENSGAFDEKAITKVIEAGNLVPYLTLFGIQAEVVVQDAFDSRGFGRWAPWKNPNYQNNTGMVLVDTTQTRKAITSKVR